MLWRIDRTYLFETLSKRPRTVKQNSGCTKEQQSRRNHGLELSMHRTCRRGSCVFSICEIQRLISSMAAKTSAGLLMFRRKAQNIEVLLVHPGGPFFRTKDAGAWTIPK